MHKSPKVRRFTDEDMPTLIGWLKRRNFKGVDITNRLPATGLTNGECTGFLFLTNSKLAWMGSFVCAPRLAEDARRSGFERVARGLRLLARKAGCEAIMTFPSTAGLASDFRTAGFIPMSMMCQPMLHIVERDK